MDSKIDRLKNYAEEQPGWFSLLITLLVLGAYIIAGILAALLTSDIVGNNLVQAIVRGLGAVAFAILLVKFGWSEASGLSRLGAPLAWLVGNALLAYEVVTHIIPLASEVIPGSQPWSETASVTLNALATGPLEEIPFRGIILIAFVRLWAYTPRGIVKSVMAASLFFGASHLVHILFGRPFPQAVFVSLNTFLAGIYYSAIVLRWKTIWPGVALHSLLNGFAALVAYQTPGFAEPAGVLFRAVLYQVPVAILALFIILRIKPESVLSSATQHAPRLHPNGG